MLFGLKSGGTNQDLEAKHVNNKRALIRGGLVVGALTLVSLAIASVILLRQAAAASAASKHYF